MHVFFFREAWRSFRAHRGLASTAIFSMTASLALAGVFLLLSFNAKQALQEIGDRREMVIYLKDEVSEKDVAGLSERIRQLYGTPTFVSRATAWEEFSQQVGDPELLKSVDTNPLPASLHVKLRPELLHFAAMESTAKQVVQFPEVEDVRYGATYVQRLDALNAGAQRAAAAAGILVALALAFVLYNTLRLTVLARRPQVETMTKLGASDRFIATPFIIEALIETLLSAVLALALVFAMQQAVVTRLAGVQFLPLEWSLTFVGAALVLTWAASSFALTRILRSFGS